MAYIIFYLFSLTGGFCKHCKESGKVKLNSHGFVNMGVQQNVYLHRKGNILMAWGKALINAQNDVYIDHCQVR